MDTEAIVVSPFISSFLPLLLSLTLSSFSFEESTNSTHSLATTFYCCCCREAKFLKKITENTLEDRCCCRDNTCMKETPWPLLLLLDQFGKHSRKTLLCLSSVRTVLGLLLSYVEKQSSPCTLSRHSRLDTPAGLEKVIKTNNNESID